MENINIVEAESMDGDCMDACKLTSDLSIDGTTDWPGRDAAIDEINDCDLFDRDLSKDSDEVIAACLLMVRTDDHPFCPPISSCRIKFDI